jgi:hypothetical protein
MGTSSPLVADLNEWPLPANARLAWERQGWAQSWGRPAALNVRSRDLIMGRPMTDLGRDRRYEQRQIAAWGGFLPVRFRARMR